MRSMLALTVAGAFFTLADEASTQSATREHVGHIMTAFEGTPDGSALLAVAEADAALAVEHARLAGRDQTDTAPMVQHARHVMHILDPAAFANGPGSGFGLSPAALAIAQHAGLAAQGAPDAVRTHAQHVAVAATAVDRRATEMIALALRITRTTDYVSAYDMVRELQALAAQLMPGADSNGDGQISVAEGGLEHVRAHMGLLSTASQAQ